MTALSAERNTLKQGGNAFSEVDSYGVAASTKVYKGSLVGLSAGYLVPASASAAIIIVGRAEETVDNTSGAAGDLVCPVRRGTFKWVNDSTSIAAANIGAVCFAKDDQTVSLTDSLGTRPVAGIIKGVDSGGVLVETVEFRSSSGSQPKMIVPLKITLAGITGTGQVVGAITPGFVGRILKTAFVTDVPATTGSKLATLQPRITGTNVTGGALALTSANQTPMGNVVAGSAVTAANTFGTADTIDVQASGVTAFVEGSGTLLLFLG